MAVEGTREKYETYGLWMLVEKKSRCKSRESSQKGTRITTNKNEGSHFRALTDMEVNVEINSGHNEEILDKRCKKGKEILLEGNQGVAFTLHNMGHLTSKNQNRGPINVLGFKNIASPTRFINTASGLVDRPISPRNLACDSRPMHTSTSKSLGESNLLKDSIRLVGKWKTMFLL